VNFGEQSEAGSSKLFYFAKKSSSLLFRLARTFPRTALLHSATFFYNDEKFDVEQHD
jgi:hypothetical protein